MYKRLFCAALVFGAAALAPPLEAQVGRCLPRPALVETLEEKFTEQLVGGGLQDPTRLIEVWSSGETGSFTIFITRPDGVACIVATGRYWTPALETARGDVAG